MRPTAAPGAPLSALKSSTTPSLAALAGFVGLLLSSGCTNQPPAQVEPPPAEISEPPTEGQPTGDTRLRTVYVPAYSHLPASQKQARMLSVLLSVRNVDSVASVTLNHVDYFDTSGHRVRRYLAEPVELEPLETAEFSVESEDEVGGSGANFLVYWEGPSDAHPLLTEAVMWGHFGAGYVAFTSRGVELARRPDPDTFTEDEEPPTGDPE